MESAHQTSQAKTLTRVARRVVMGLAIGLQVFFIVRAYDDPHTHFGYQPFNESSIWRADLYRVTADGQRISIRDGWFGYRWEEMVTQRGLGQPYALHHADSGVDSTVDFLEKALDYVADHTPNDSESIYLEADVTYFRNTYGPQHRLLRSKKRQETSR